MNGYNTILGGKNTTQWQIQDASETIIKAQSIGQSNQSRLTIDRYKGTVEIQPDGYKGTRIQITKNSKSSLGKYECELIKFLAQSSTRDSKF